MKLSHLLLCLPLWSAAAEMPPYLPEPLKIETKKFLVPGDVRCSNAGKTFAPSDFVRIRSLNGVWKFSGVETAARPFAADCDPDLARPEFDDSGWHNLDVPFNWYADRRFSYDLLAKQQDVTGYFQKNPFAKGWYRRKFELKPEELRNTRISLHFDVIGYEGAVFVNGKNVGVAHGDFVPTELDVTDAVRAGENNIAVRVLSDFRPDGKNGFKLYRTYGAMWSPRNLKAGLWQPVSLAIEPEIKFSAVAIASRFAAGEIDLRCEIGNFTGREQLRDITVFVTDAAQTDANRLNTALTVPGMKLAPGITKFGVTVKLNNPKPWEIRDANLYFLTLASSVGDTVDSAKTTRFGFREFTIDGTRFRLNGKPIYLCGENLVSANFGGSRTEAAERWQLKHEISARLSAGCVILRTAHMPPIRLTTEIADELGMMIYDEWSFCFSVGAMDEPRFEKTNRDELRRFIQRDFNAPSVVMWSLGNASPNQSGIAAPVAQTIRTGSGIGFPKTADRRIFRHSKLRELRQGEDRHRRTRSAHLSRH